MIPVEVGLSPCVSNYEAGLIVSIRDVSERIKAESEFDLLSQKLTRAQRLEAIGMLSGGATHDFSNLLTAIAGNVELARRKGSCQNHVAERLDAISLATERAMQLVRRVLAADERSMPTRYEQSMVGLIDEAVDLLRSSLPAGVVLELHIGRDVPNVLLDATQTYQVIMNLCTNAVRALEGGEGRVVLSLEKLVVVENSEDASRVSSGEYALLSVSDDGSGIEEDCLSLIFESFYTTNHDGKGTGLGLAIVSRVAEEHGWKVAVSSILGEGTTFKVYIPAAQKTP